MIEVFDDSEQQLLEPDFDNIVDQMAHHVYNPEVFDLVNQKLGNPYDDPEDLFEDRRWSVEGFLMLWGNYDRFIDQKSEMGRDVRRAFKMRSIGVEYTDEYTNDSWTLTAIPLMDPLNLFYGAYTSGSLYHIAFSIQDLSPKKLNLQFEGPDGDLLVVAALYPFTHKGKVHVHVDEYSWVFPQTRKVYEAWKICFGVWVYTVMNMLRIPLDRFRSPHGEQIVIPYEVEEELS